MNLSSSILKNRAKIKLQGLYGQSLLVTLLYTMCISALSSVGSAVTLFSSGLPMMKEAFSAMQDGASGSEAYANPFRFSISFVPLSSLSAVAAFLVMGPLMVGTAHYFLRVTDRNNPQIADLFGEFKNFGNTVVLYLLISLFSFLWTMLFMIPCSIIGTAVFFGMGAVTEFSRDLTSELPANAMIAIAAGVLFCFIAIAAAAIVTMRYAMAQYIIAEHPEIKPLDAINMSKQMMKGHLGEYFLLQLSFIGWWLLCLLTCLIGSIFLTPYIYAANAEFFNEVSGKNVEKRNAGIDPDGTATFFGAAGAPPAGNYQPQSDNGYNGWQQSQASQPFGGYAQPGQPQQPQNYGSCPQPENGAGSPYDDRGGNNL